MYTFNCCFIPTDRTKRPRFETCIIHCSDDESLLISPKDLDSRKSLLKGATIRNHRPLVDLAENVKGGEIPHVSYHRKCCLFTMKRDLESISQTTAAASQIPEFNMESEEQRTIGKNQARAELIRKYAFSAKRRRHIKKEARTRDPVTQCVDLRADATIRKAAIAAGDSRIIGLASRDLVAAEAWYHGQCYRDYTRPDKACKYSDLDDEPDWDETNYCNIVSTL